MGSSSIAIHVRKWIDRRFSPVSPMPNNVLQNKKIIVLLVKISTTSIATQLSHLPTWDAFNHHFLVVSDAVPHCVPSAGNWSGTFHFSNCSTRTIQHTLLTLLLAGTTKYVLFCMFPSIADVATVRCAMAAIVMATEHQMYIGPKQLYNFRIPQILHAVEMIGICFTHCEYFFDFFC